jgi:ParB family chromosome partitioning protein
MSENPKSGKRNALGRGLSALLPGSEDAPQPPHSLVPPVPEALAETHSVLKPTGVYELPLADIEANPYQPRTDFAPEALAELAESIRTQGVVQPITVREIEPGKYQIIAGERRTRASRLAGLETIPAYVRRANDEQMLEMAIVENVQREDLNPIETALAYKRLMDECSLTIEAVGDRVGKKRATVNNYLRLLKLPPEIQASVRDGSLSMGHARALITLDNPLHQIALYQRILAENLSVRAVEDAVRRLGEPEPPKATATPKPAPTPAQLQVKALERDLESRFGTKVQIHYQDGTGEIRLKYYSDEDLTRLLELLNT